MSVHLSQSLFSRELYKAFWHDRTGRQTKSLPRTDREKKKTAVKNFVCHCPLAIRLDSGQVEVEGLEC